MDGKFFDPRLEEPQKRATLVEKTMNGELPIDHYITHVFKGVEGTNDAIEALHSGDCLRAVVTYFD